MKADEKDLEIARVAVNIALTVAGSPFTIGGPSKGTWDPVKPEGTERTLPPVAADGTVECWACRSRVLFADANIANEAYVCAPCVAKQARAAAAASLPANADDIKLARPKTGLYIALATALLLAITIAIIYAYRW